MMFPFHPPDTARRWLWLPRRTARLRLTVLYSGLFLGCGSILLAVSYVLVVRAIDPPDFCGRLGQLAIAPVVDACSQRRSTQLVTVLAKEIAGSDLRQVLVQAPAALAIVTALALALGWLVAGRVLRPLATITAAAHRISASNLHQRLALRGPDDELKALGDTLDDLFARLEAAFEGQRHFVASASHELRTPLTRERTMLQVALDDPGTTAETWRNTALDVLASNTEQESLIEALLTLATSEGGLDRREPVDLAAITGEVLLARRPEASRRGLRVQVAIQPAVLDGDPLLTERLAANLIDNAVRHNLPDGYLTVATATRDGRASLSVSSTGLVIPPAEVGRLFQPFQRLHPRGTPDSGGHGLGLSIVRAIAAAHGATIEARAQAEGGLAVDVTFPSYCKPASGRNTAQLTVIAK
ncbi:MAG TPA: ATP-binding protein [Trebonia sp.]|nr:ATP-binding protein [Trebonia sp.]